LCWHIPQEYLALRDGRWQTIVGVGLAGKTLGVLEVGTLGSQVARVGAAFGMDVVAWSHNLFAERCAEIGVRRLDKDDLLSTARCGFHPPWLSERTAG
jgi:phosphoglycerate dehydrogenase-like enzyme